MFLERGEGKREGEIHWCARDTQMGCLSCTPNWGSGRLSRHAPWLVIEEVTFHFTGWHSIDWATPARATFIVLSRKGPCVLGFFWLYYLVWAFTSESWFLYYIKISIISIRKKADKFSRMKGKEHEQLTKKSTNDLHVWKMFECI